MSNSYRVYKELQNSIRLAIATCMAEHDLYSNVSSQWDRVPPSLLVETKDPSHPAPGLPPLSPVDADNAASYCLGVAALLRAVCLPQNPVPDARMTIGSQNELRTNGGAPPARWSLPLGVVDPSAVIIRPPSLMHTTKEGSYGPIVGVQFDGVQASMLGLRATPNGSLNTIYEPDAEMDDFIHRGRNTSVAERGFFTERFNPRLVHPEPVNLPPGITPGMLLNPVSQPQIHRTPEQVAELESATAQWVRANGYADQTNDRRRR